MDTINENCNNTKKQEYRENLYKRYLIYGENQRISSCSQYITQTQQEEIEFLQQLKAKHLPVNECMAAYYVLVYHKKLDPSAVKAALLAGSDPEQLIECETIFDIRTEKYCDRISGTVGELEVYDAASDGSRWNDSPYF